MLIERNETPLWTGLVFSAVVASFVWSETPHRRVLAWLGLRLGITLVRAALHLSYRRRQPSESVLRWERPYLVVLALDGLIWGLIATWLAMPDQSVTVAASLAVVVCLAAVASHVVSAHGWGYVAFTFPLLVPVVAYHLFQPSRISFYGAISALAYLVQSGLDVLHTSRGTRELIRLRYELAGVAEQRAIALATANHAGEAKLRFLTRMSHEMRTPLHGILGTVRLLKRRHTMNDDRVLLEITERSGSHLLRLIENVLDFAKAGNGGVKLSDRPYDCASVVRDVAEMLRPMASEKGVSIVEAPDPMQALRTRGDASKFRQIVLNLVGNAIKFADHGTIEIRLVLLDASIVLTVRDQGVGIPEAELDSVFEPFHQADDSFGRRFEGTGLGLSISRDLARAMGGDLVCAESKQGVGSTFRLELPFTSAVTSVAAPSIPPAGLAASFQGRVMLVDDNSTNAILGRAILEELGVEVDVCEGGLAAVEAATKPGIDLIFMDCQMPGLDGLEATRRIREHERASSRAPVPIVALTAHSASDDYERCIEAGMNDYLAKPFRMEQIEAILARFLRTSAPSLGSNP
jgi:signal transduction histidine kinase/ActR/RegA family two-component response regulator